MTSNEPLSTISRNATSRPRILVYLTHAVLFLLATAAGAALIYSLQPPKPPTGPLLFDIDFFTSHEPLQDFNAPRAALQQTTPGTTTWSGADFFGNHQVSTQPQETLRFTMATPTYLKEFRNFAPLRFEVSGVPHGDRIRVPLKIGVNKVDASHHLELAASEGRIVQFTYGEAPYRRWCYAIIQVQPQASFPSVGTTLSGPKTAASTED